MFAALGRLDPPRRSWRILAVDNASTDDTPQLLATAAQTLPLTPLSCPIPGKMAALKTAAQAVEGDLIVFTDDDVEPDAAWLRAYEDAADAADERVGLFGGPITPTPIDEVGPWFDACRAHHPELFALSDEPDGSVDAAAHVFGPNYMIRRAHLDILDAVAPGLGPTFVKNKAASFAMGEDTQMMELLATRGVEAAYVRAARVRHLVRAFQTDLDVMLERAERHGRGAAIRLAEEKERSLWRRVRIVLDHAVRAMTAPRAPAGAAPAADLFETMWRARWSRGMVKGAVLGPFPPPPREG